MAQASSGCTATSSDPGREYDTRCHDAVPALRHLLRANGCSDRTIDNYLYALKGFTRFLGERSRSETTADDIIAYQVDVAARGLSDSSVRVATYALRGFFQKVLERSDWNYARLPRPRRPQRLPEVLSVEEVRTDEVVHLEPRHVDSQRMLIRVERGKGQKDRQVVLSERLLRELRHCWKTWRATRLPLDAIIATLLPRAP